MVFGPYERVVQYYETDMMGIVHHSNYIRWFEESRVWSLQQVGFEYRSIEDRGIVIPVLEVSAKYRKSLTYGDTMQVYLKLVYFNGVRFGYEYEIKNKDTEELCTTGSSSHCFLSRSGKIINIRKEYPEFYDMLREYSEPKETEE